MPSAAVDWARVIADCQVTRLAPQLLPVPDLKLTPEDSEAALLLQTLAAEMRSRGFDSAMLATDRAWGEHASLRVRFASTMDLRQEVMNLGSC